MVVSIGDVIRVVPVLDVMGGFVVRAIAGKREEYRPLTFSTISNSPDPIDVLKGFKNLGCNIVYIADIDAIIGRGRNDLALESALLLGFRVWIDAGKEGLMKTDNEEVTYVIGTEYLMYPEDLPLLRNRFVSLDIKQNAVTFQNTKLDVVRVANEICSKDVRMILVLFLDYVGTLKGIDLEVVREIRDICSKISVAVGGGLRDVEELLMLKRVGVDYALMATAIHKGTIDRCVY